MAAHEAPEDSHTDVTSTAMNVGPLASSTTGGVGPGVRQVGGELSVHQRPPRFRTGRWLLLVEGVMVAELACLAVICDAMNSGYRPSSALPRRISRRGNTRREFDDRQRCARRYRLHSSTAPE